MTFHKRGVIKYQQGNFSSSFLWTNLIPKVMKCYLGDFIQTTFNQSNMYDLVQCRKKSMTPKSTRNGLFIIKATIKMIIWSTFDTTVLKCYLGDLSTEIFNIQRHTWRH